MSRRKEELKRQHRNVSQDIVALAQDFPELLDPLERDFEENPNEIARDRLMYVRDDLVKATAQLMDTETIFIEWLLLLRRLDVHEPLPLPVEYAYPHGDLCGFVAELDKRFRLRRCDHQVAWIHACHSAEKGFATGNRSAVRAFLISRNGRQIVERLAMDFTGGERLKLYEALLAFDWKPWRQSFRDIDTRLTD